MADVQDLQQSDFDTYIAATSYKLPFVDGQGNNTYDGNEFEQDGVTPNPTYDGPMSYFVDENGDLNAVATVSERFMKYPWPAP